MIKNSDKLQKLFQSLSGEVQQVTAVPKELIHFTGNPSKALLLAQLIYWSDRGVRRDGFIWKSYAEIFEETGIKQKTCSRYYDEFREMGFFNWKQKLAMGRNVVHFKLDMDKLTELIKTYWQSRDRQYIQLEMDKMSDSITENTAKITSIDKTLSDDKKKEKSDENFSNENYIHNASIDFADVLINAGFREQPQTPLPPKFEPSLENQFWAVTSFTNKPVSLATESFKDFYDQRPENIKTSAGWQSEWRKWMTREEAPRGYSQDKLEAEREAIIAEVRNRVHYFAIQCGSSILRSENFYSVLIDEENGFSKETIDACIDELKWKKNMFPFFDDYIYTPRKRRDLVGGFSHDSGQIFGDWTVIDDSIWKFIVKNNPVSPEEVQRKFSKYCQNSVKAYLDSGVACEALALDAGQLWDEDQYPGWRVPVGFHPILGEYLEVLQPAVY